MPIPERKYYYLNEIVKCWSISEIELEYLIENGHLTACFFLLNIDVESGYYEKTGDGRLSATPYEIITYRGLHPLLPDDCRQIFRRGNTKIHYFYVDSPNEYCRICKDDGLKVQSCDLVITCLEKYRCEKEFAFKSNGITSPTPSLATTNAANESIFYQENNYQYIEYRGFVFDFGMIQAKIIEILHRASKTDCPWIHCKHLLDKAGSTSTRVRDLFKSKKGWQELILSDGKGRYRINL